MAQLSRLVCERLMRYYRRLSELTAKKPLQTVTSAQLAQALDIDATQVRKDLGAVGLLGMHRVGFDVCEICRHIRFVLGFDREYQAVLIGAGHLGGALLAYPRFARYGLRILAAFDNDPGRIGRQIAGCPVKSVRALKPFIARHEVSLAVLTTPAEVSQKLTDRVVSAGVRAIWNFTPTRLDVPPGVLVRNEHIAVGLSQIAYHLRGQSEPQAGRQAP